MKKRLLPIALILVIAILFAPLCGNFVRETVVIPFLYIFWILQFLLAAIPQVTFWPCFVLLMFLIMVVSFVQRPKVQPKTKAPDTAERQRVETWAMLLKKAKGDDYFKWRLAKQMQKLLLESMAHKKGQSFSETRAQLRQNTLDMPPDIRAYFQASLQSLGNLSPNSRFRLKKVDTPLDLNPAIVADYLEKLNRAGYEEAEMQ